MIPDQRIIELDSVELFRWVEDIREDLRQKIEYCEQFLGHLPVKEWEFFRRLREIIPDPKEKAKGS